PILLEALLIGILLNAILVNREKQKWQPALLHMVERLEQIVDTLFLEIIPNNFRKVDRKRLQLRHFAFTTLIGREEISPADTASEITNNLWDTREAKIKTLETIEHQLELILDMSVAIVDAGIYTVVLELSQKTTEL